MTAETGHLTTNASGRKSFCQTLFYIVTHDNLVGGIFVRLRSLTQNDFTSTIYCPGGQKGLPFLTCGLKTRCEVKLFDLLNLIRFPREQTQHTTSLVKALAPDDAEDKTQPMTSSEKSVRQKPQTNVEAVAWWSLLKQIKIRQLSKHCSQWDQVSVLVHSKRDESFLALEGDTGLWLPSGEVLFRQTWQNAAAKCVQPYFARPIQVNRFIRLNRIWSSNLKHYISHAIFIVDVVREVKEAVKLINGAKWVSLEALIGENTNNPSLRTSKLLEIVRHYEDLKEETFNSGKFPYFGTILHEIGPLDEEDGSVSAKELLQAQLLGQSGSKEKSTQSEQGNGEGTEMAEYELATHSVRVKSSGTITDVSTLFGLEDEAAVTQSALKAAEETGEAGLEKTIPRGSFDPSAQGNQMLTALRYFREATEDKLAYSWGIADMTNLGKYVVSLCRNVTEIFAKEPRLVRLTAPTYIFGDFHGNYKDLAYFEKAVWKLGPILTPASFLFLGDYVDRGPHGVEVVTDLFAQKLLCPDKVILLRGNHETRRTQLRYGFKAECLIKFGNLGDVVWEAINNAFDCLPLAAIVDDKIFCAHGGIAPPDVGGLSLEEYEKIPVPLPEPEQESKLAWEVMWCDPADEGDVEEKKKELKENEGFAVNEKRNTGHLFSPEALEQFLATNKLSYVVRAHEEKQAGFQVEQNAKLLTVFSSSNYGGRNNEAACILVDHGKLRVIRLDSC